MSTVQNQNSVFDQIEAAAQAQSRFIKVQPGQTMLLKFDTNKVRLVDRELNGKKSKGAEYTVVDPNNPTEEKVLTLSLSWALNLNELLKSGFTNVKISRRGSGLDTSYNFVPA